jgi:hypothetical protein
MREVLLDRAQSETVVPAGGLVLQTMLHWQLSAVGQFA